MLSYFLRHVISAGALLDVQTCLPRAHSVRGVATLLSILRNWLISKVLEAAASWRLRNALSSFLRHVISSAGALRGDQTNPPQAHSLRGVATYAAFLRNWSVS